ncbi:MAG TPA: RNA polymerase sigma-70 factor [Arachidicoccus soli]|uniref:RNA polymerase sigma-70 factor n=1 Tax=Arachidicoccus soli TaxID=2341117 RepID=A0A386HPP9_9BACT|nr:RNA polymerase sigma-70 factor [Arachidicoccus soli]AYD47629.1 RNA polymerase sigma-70 factor [Arachidicoccus soli]HEU0227001.1 RNA polymerase sigma-70 factor [Arachidicoccus soli]
MNAIQENYCLIKDISKGDEQAFQKLFMYYKDKVYSIALVYSENSNDAEEVVQDIFLRIWKYRAKLMEINNLEAWLITITRNSSLTLLKKRALESKRKEGLSDYFPKYINDTTYLIEEKQLQGILEEALKHLSPRQRKIFELSKIQGKDRTSIAQSLGLSPATVSVHLTIAIRVVRNFLHGNIYKTSALLFLIKLILF